MREILFRGKRLVDGEWITGYFVVTGRYNAIKPNGEVYYGVDPSTIGQFTGLTDKNGKRIFEGDVVKGVDHLNPYLSVSGYVSFADASFCIVDEYFSHYRWHDYELEVIGNFHDNPELLEVSGDG